jgi:Polyketide cyclase / dehydrase and lipid transport
MSQSQIFSQSIQINSNSAIVERCIIEKDLMHKWLNPILRCDPVGEWSTEVGSKSIFIIQIPFIQPTLKSIVIERQPGLIVWEFQGFFRGSDRWECLPNNEGTLLINTFTFTIPNPIVMLGFNLFAAKFTKYDMQTQLQRLKRVAEKISQKI